MSKLLEGKLALILGIANKWSLAYAIAQAFSREGGTLALTYLGERQKDSIEELAKDLNVTAILPCDVTKDEELAALTESLRGLNRPLHAVVHSLAFANREDLTRPSWRPAVGLSAGAGRELLLAGGGSARHRAAHDRGRFAQHADVFGSTRVVPNYNVMGVAKASLEAAMRYLASEMGAQKIRVNAHLRRGRSRRPPRAPSRILDDPRHHPEPRPIAAQYRPGGSRRHRRIPGQRPRPRRHRKHSVRRAGMQIMGV